MLYIILYINYCYLYSVIVYSIRVQKRVARKKSRSRTEKKIVSSGEKQKKKPTRFLNITLCPIMYNKLGIMLYTLMQ